MIVNFRDVWYLLTTLLTLRYTLLEKPENPMIFPTAHLYIPLSSRVTFLLIVKNVGGHFVGMSSLYHPTLDTAGFAFTFPLSQVKVTASSR